MQKLTSLTVIENLNDRSVRRLSGCLGLSRFFAYSFVVLSVMLMCNLTLAQQAQPAQQAAQPLQLGQSSQSIQPRSSVRPGSSTQPNKSLSVGAPAIYLMGEVHDNPAIHEARLERLKQDLGAGWRPALIMEQFDRERQTDLTRAWQTCSDAACVIKRAGGDGWNWSLYEPIIQLALQYRLPLIAGNVSRQDASKIMRGGYEAVFDTAAQQQLGLQRLWPETMTTQQVQSILDGHCGVLPEAMAMPMVQAQRARDAMMADLIVQYAQQGVVLIAGNGHVQRDVGVYRWLPTDLLPNVTVMGFVEPGGIDFQAYDEVIVLPAFERPDPCIAFMKMMRQSKPVAKPTKG
jgi:uncharacterized iron-regulated protein